MSRGDDEAATDTTTTALITPASPPAPNTTTDTSDNLGDNDDEATTTTLTVTSDEIATASAVTGRHPVPQHGGGAATVDPVFLLNKLLPTAHEMNYAVAEICAAAEKTSGFDTIVGAQRTGGLWRLYPKTVDARVALLTRGIVLRGITVQPRDKNPFIVRDEEGRERETAALKVFVTNISLSFNNRHSGHPRDNGQTKVTHYRRKGQSRRETDPMEDGATLYSCRSPV
ncbi:hypothetical protein ACOMHN_058083 [Nucella lapillus]